MRAGIRVCNGLLWFRMTRQYAEWNKNTRNGKLLAKSSERLHIIW